MTSTKQSKPGKNAAAQNRESAPVPPSSDVQSPDLVSAVRAKFQRLSRSDKKVARLLLESPEQFIKSSVAGVGKAAEVSDATVVRFGRTFGCAGFRDFKILLAQNLAARQALRDAGGGVGAQAGAGNFIDRICGSAVANLQETAAQLNLDAIETGAQMVASAKRAPVYGVGGSSSSLAQELHNRLFRLGIASTPYVDGYMQRMSAAALNSNDVALFISSTGRPQSLVESAELAKNYGAGTVALTDADSSLGREVDVCLNIRLTQADVAVKQPNPMRYAQLLIIDCLVYRVADIRGACAQSTLERVRASVAAMHGIAPQQPIGD